MARKNYDNTLTHCVVCGEEVASDRAKRGAITCSKEHGKERRDQLQAWKDKKECRYCRQPATPEQQEAYKRFRQLESKRPDLLYPEAFEDWKASGGTPTPKAFAEYRKKNEH